MSLKDLTYYFYNTPFGQLTIASNGHAITELCLGCRELSGTFKPCAITNACSTQVLQYLSGIRKSFDLDIEPRGTNFQLEVWAELVKVPYGQITAPSDLAIKIGKRSSYRRIPLAAHSSPILFLIPSHRLVPASKFEKPSEDEKIRLALRNLEKKYLARP